MNINQLAPLLLYLFFVQNASADNLSHIDMPKFTAVQKDLFEASGAQSVAWADYDNDGDLDLAVTFKNRPNRLYQNNQGVFVDVAAKVGWEQDIDDARALAWGDYNNDGHLDLYLGYGRDTATANRLYRNEGYGRKFTEVAAKAGLNLTGTTRQSSWIDFDHDGDLDLFVAMRDRYNRLFQNDKGTFTDVTRKVGLRDPRRTVGAVWFDMDADGDLDLFLANQSGDRDAFYRNDNGKFVDVAEKLNMDRPRRPIHVGSTGVGAADFDNDGDLDLFVSTYAANLLYQNDGRGNFIEVAQQMGVAGNYHAVGVDWGDFDNDGRIDLYVASYLNGILNERDYLYRNAGSGFRDVLPLNLHLQDADHGVRWADYDNDGDLDLALASNHQQGNHQLFRNDMKKSQASQALRVLVLDKHGHFTQAGAEVRVYQAGSERLLGTRLVDTAGGYSSQNAMPVHFGLTGTNQVDVAVTSMSSRGPQVTRIENVNIKDYQGSHLAIRVSSPSKQK